MLNLLIAFSAGFISFLSPCVLPLIPGYISYISGQTLDEIIEDNKSVLLKTIFFSVGFSIVFISFGITASFIGKFLINYSNQLRIIAGLIIILFSLQLIGLINLKILNSEARFFTKNYRNNLIFPVIVGMAFGFGWTPCIGPILGSILALAAIEENISKGILLLSFYSLGLAIPFIISGVLIDKFLFFSKSFRKYISTITKVGGAILLLTGIAILTGQLQVLGFFILEYFPSLGNIG
ncbi:MAG: sulfite exporter TauE/SafE family protein [Pelagibacteraceae bacterium]|nr:sulfite exporter TauE/SafE family protein [Pelagibacteraceae bacterium]MBO6491449.1 sulfite exporter TauE/SafE family protein [Pelagibacteraceae bacterium]MBO6492012.1 sulfite exporter TauE/SafE family protein [Pelagibacteraceae bacterium]MBO6493516.1 sulfite exporter TauE/SafE family protein [Pelagibacteraceae bacterium]